MDGFSAAAAAAAKTQPSKEFVDRLGGVLTKTEMTQEDFLAELCELVEKQIGAEGGGADEGGDHETAGSYRRRVSELVDGYLLSLSIIIKHKFGPMAKDHLMSLFEERLSAQYSRVVEPPAASSSEMSLRYAKCFDAWIDSPEVSFSTTNYSLLGNLDEKETFVLHFFSMLCCRRVRGDNAFAIAITGASSIGKSLLFEDPLFENAFSYTSESGCGKYDVRRKSVFIYHDIHLKLLCKQTESEKFKTMCRSEPTNVKVFSRVEEINPVFVVVTSNMRIHDHAFGLDEAGAGGGGTGSGVRDAFPAAAPSLSRPSCIASTKKRTRAGLFFAPASLKSSRSRDFLESQLPGCLPQSQRELNRHNLESIQKRVLEVCGRSRPALDPRYLPRSGVFRRRHAIRGTYMRVLEILEKHSREDVYSDTVLSYVATGLADNYAVFARHAGPLLPPDVSAEEVGRRLCRVVDRYFEGDRHRREYRERMKWDGAFSRGEGDGKDDDGGKPSTPSTQDTVAFSEVGDDEDCDARAAAEHCSFPHGDDDDDDEEETRVLLAAATAAEAEAAAAEEEQDTWDYSHYPYDEC